MECLKRSPTFQQVAYCKNLLDGHSVAQRGRFDGAYFQQYFGMLAQTVIADLIGEKRPERCRAGTTDGGVDLVINGVNLDVKCALRDFPPKTNWACNVTEAQIKYAECQGYIFVSYDKSEGIFYILGWMGKEEFLRKAKHTPIGAEDRRDDGTVMKAVAGFHGLPISKLHRIKTVEDLRTITIKGRN